MIDSSSKIPEGILSGSFDDFGNYDECLSVEVKENWRSFKGQYCLASLNIIVNEEVSYNEKIIYMYKNGVCLDICMLF